MKKLLLIFGLCFSLTAPAFAADPKSSDTEPKLVPTRMGGTESLVNVNYSENRINELERRLNDMDRSLRSINDNIRSLQRDVNDLRRRRDF